ncbi:MAG: adenosylcobinamide-GDP ribazoletransferase, partial [Anaerovoracaceae bacterium]
AFLLIFWFALLFSLISKENTSVLGAMFLIPVVSRGFSGSCVLTYTPIGHSQYVENEHDPERGKCRAGIIIQLLIYIAAVEAVYCALGNMRMMIITLVMCAVEAAVSFIACAHGRKQLGGISGDIAGYTIVWSELAAVAALVIAADMRCFGGVGPWF